VIPERQIIIRWRKGGEKLKDNSYIYKICFLGTESTGTSNKDRFV
jgi:hypothetical protein